MLRLILAVFAIKFNEFNLLPENGQQLSAAPSISIGILMIPLFDTIRVFIIRLLRKKPFRNSAQILPCLVVLAWEQVWPKQHLQKELNQKSVLNPHNAMYSKLLVSHPHRLKHF